MNPEIKTRWVEALKSGKYTKDPFALKRLQPDGTYSHCVFGVLCELAQREDVVKTGQVEGRNLFYFQGKQVYTSHPPVEVLKWAGLPPGDFWGCFSKPVGRESVDWMNHKDLVHLNWYTDFSLPEIAQVIQDQF